MADERPGGFGPVFCGSRRVSRLRCRGLMLDRVIRAVLVVLPLTTCATRLHVHAVDPPDVTMEVTRCLRLISVAASKRHTPPDDRAELGFVLAGRPPEQDPRLEKISGRL
jgi:hypothetical protein